MREEGQPFSYFFCYDFASKRGRPQEQRFRTKSSPLGEAHWRSFIIQPIGRGLAFLLGGGGVDPFSCERGGGLGGAKPLPLGKGKPFFYEKNNCRRRRFALRSFVYAPTQRATPRVPQSDDPKGLSVQLNALQ